MALTRIDCAIYRGVSASIESSAFLAINPSRRPGNLVISGAVAGREALGGQVACRLAIEHFVDAVLDYYEQNPAQVGGTPPEGGELSVRILEKAFQRANSSVYEFGHRLSAGGRLGASLLGLAVEQRTVAAGRVGQGAAYLARNHEFCPFFERRVGSAPRNLVGENSLVTVELSSIPIEEGDVIFVFGRELDQDEQDGVSACVRQLRTGGSDAFSHIVETLFEDADALPFALCAMMGPEVIYLGSDQRVAGGIK